MDEKTFDGQTALFTLNNLPFNNLIFFGLAPPHSLVLLAWWMVRVGNLGRNNLTHKITALYRTSDVGSGK